MILVGAVVVLGFMAFNPKEDINIIPVTDNLKSDDQIITKSDSTKSQLIDENTVTKKEWGISFVKTSEWKIINITNKILLKPGPDQGDGDEITIEYFTGDRITDSDAKFGEITYFYDNTKKEWMRTDTMEGEGISPNTSPINATIAFKTDSGLPVFNGVGRWKTYIIPLSTNTFVKLNILGSGDTQALTELTKTLKII